jgi:succinate-semialdehyde dehydrogenase/glutarate-semialdehyde dehydrogenase
MKRQTIQERSTILRNDDGNCPSRFDERERRQENVSQLHVEKIERIPEAAKLKIGNGIDPSTQLGPLANPRRVDAMERLADDAKKRGARVLAGVQRINNRGYFYPLTVLADVPDDALAMEEEPFGPLALVNPVRNLGEAIAKANALPFGLAADAFTKSADNVQRISNDVETGNHHQPLRRLDGGNTFWRRQGLGLWPRRGHGGPRMLHGDEERVA